MKLDNYRTGQQNLSTWQVCMAARQHSIISSYLPCALYSIEKAIQWDYSPRDIVCKLQENIQLTSTL